MGWKTKDYLLEGIKAKTWRKGEEDEEEMWRERGEDDNIADVIGNIWG